MAGGRRKDSIRLDWIGFSPWRRVPGGGWIWIRFGVAELAFGLHGGVCQAKIVLRGAELAFGLHGGIMPCRAKQKIRFG